MMLTALILVFFVGGLVAWYAERWNPRAPFYISLAALVIEAFLVVMLFSPVSPADYVNVGGMPHWLAEIKKPWIPRFGIHYHLALDGLSQLLIALTVVLGFMAVSSSWTEIKQRTGFFCFNLMFCLTGTVGIFLSMDLFLFFFFWEIMIIPMYFLISIWGHENRIYAAIKFFIFTQVSGLIMLLAIITLAFIQYDNTGSYSFDYFDLLKASLNPSVAFALMLCFFVAFTVKLPAVPLHTWLPDAHTQAPTGGSVILAGIMLKTGAYGLLRFVINLFPEAAQQFAPFAMALGAVSILYAAKMAFSQSDLKRLIAYTSVSHMGFILLGVFSATLLAFQGSVITMLAHGISAAALFMIAGALQERLHTRDMRKMGGFWLKAPRLSGISLFFALASLGLPGLGNFIGEFLVLLGAFKVNMVLTIVSALVLILSPIYSLIIVQKVFHGPLADHYPLSDFGRREMLSMGVLVLSTFWLGVHPQSFLDVAAPPLRETLQRISPGR